MGIVASEDSVCVLEIIIILLDWNVLGVTCTETFLLRYLSYSPIYLEIIYLIKRIKSQVW